MSIQFPVPGFEPTTLVCFHKNKIMEPHFLRQNVNSVTLLFLFVVSGSPINLSLCNDSRMLSTSSLLSGNEKTNSN